MRRPSDRSELWRAWREHVAPLREGERRKRWRFNPNDPQCGRYQAKRGGQWVAVQIDIAPPEVDENGELLADEQFVAWVGEEKFEGERVFDIWARCCQRPITDEEWRRLMKLAPIVEGSDLTRTVIT